jgi:1-acyl-sn-glycerol-3-phosphate acyltransferase
MPQLVTADSSYKFVPPHEGNLWPKILAAVTPKVLRKKCGITRTEVRGAEKLAPLVSAGHGILLAPNHSRMSDALVLQHLSRELRQPFFIMASSHLFRGSRFQAFMLRRLGAFSVNREGVDREAVQYAIEILSSGKRPLVIFPEGALSQANERMNALMEGVSFIARAAAKKLERVAKESGAAENRKVFVVPVAIRYLFKGDLEATVMPLLADIECRLSWRTREDVPLVERILSVGAALLSLKELY